MTTRTKNLDYLSVVKPKYLKEDFLADYAHRKAPFRTAFGLLVFLRTYSRYVKELKRREKWWEVVLRVVEYSLSLYQGSATHEELKAEAEDLFDQIYNLKLFPAGRTLWVGGSEVSRTSPTANFNCSFRTIDSLEAYPEMFYLLMVGAGTGFSIEKKYVSCLPQLSTDFLCQHYSYNPVPKNQRREFTELLFSEDEGLFGFKETQLVLNNQYIVDSQSTLVEDTLAQFKERVYVTLNIGDSKEGWVGALKAFLHALTTDKVKGFRFNYSHVRPEGERLLTMGGRSSGPEPLRRLFEKVTRTVKRCGGRLKPIDAMDLANFIAEIVVVGGVRRSSQIALGDEDDQDFVSAKLHLWSGANLTDEKLEELCGLITSQSGYVVDRDRLAKEVEKERQKDPYLVGTPVKLVFNQIGGEHRFLWSGDFPKLEEFVDDHDSKFRYRASRVMSNNSIHFYHQPSREELGEIFDRIAHNGEPGIYVAANAMKRRPRYKGTNPCTEVLLDNQGVCNLTEVPVTAFVRGPNDFDAKGFDRAVALATRVGSRITNVTMWHPEWDAVQKRDRLLGVSLTGQVEAWDALGWGYEIINGEYTYKTDDRIQQVLARAKHVARQEADLYHAEMGIPPSLLVTTGKPSGTIAQLPTVSSGCHRPYAPYYLRRIRIAKQDPVAKSLLELGFPAVPENNQGTDIYAEQCKTLVFTFPMKTSAPIRAIDERAVDQLERYKMLMGSYIEHSQSITVTVRGQEYDSEWQPIPGTSEWEEVIDWLSKKENWDSVIGVSFLARWDPSEGNSVYPNLPYQPSTQEEYELLSPSANLDEEQLLSLISKYEQEYEETELEADCNDGFCPVR